ncbi:MAG: ABC transporter permease [Lactimicrobium sp.]|jgi:ABC-2 type transport system permease protein|uniref:ABC transporter permease n=1 Tax=Lactimicrobium sp. TaxID=2563780 RepID=UPI002F35E3C4
MKQFGIILRFELKEIFSSKAFKAVTIIAVIIMALIMFVPKLIKNILTPSSLSNNTIAVSADWNSFDQSETDAIQSAIKKALPTDDIQFVSDDADTLQKQVKDDELDGAVMINSSDFSRYTYYVKDQSMYDANTSVFDGIFTSMLQQKALEEENVSSSKASAILQLSASHDIVNLGSDMSSTFIYAYIMVMALYTVIAMYGQMVASRVAAEKDSRAMELLISSASPTSLMFGKVISACLAGIFQITVIFGSAIIFAKMNKSIWTSNSLLASIFNIPGSLLGYMIIFFLLGLLIYAFLFGAIGSTVSRIEDLGTAVTPITMILVICFMIAMFAMSSGNLNNTFIKVCSYIPFTSPMVMFTRIAMPTVPAWEITLSIVILVISVFLVGKLSAKIYRTGVLMYGQKIKPFTLIKMIWKA